MNRMKAFLQFSILIVVLLTQAPSRICAQNLEKGPGEFSFTSPASKKTVRVFYFMPNSFQKRSRILFVMHGVNRDAERYRDDWIDHAKKHRFLLLAPEFSKNNFPGSAQYNLGNMRTKDGTPNDESLWSYTIIEQLFDRVKEMTGSEAETYNIYGHSAGAQFVHRLALFKTDARFDVAVAANAGWYTLPTDAVDFPYGLKSSILSEAKLSSVFGKQLVVLLGKEDTNEDDPNLRETAEALAQGKNRLERGRNFINTAKETASRTNSELKWKLKHVPRAGHHDKEMSVQAVPLLR